MGLEVAIVLLPGLAALVAGLFGRVIGTKGAQAVTCLGIVAAALLSAFLYWKVSGVNVAGAISSHPGLIRTVLLDWITVGDFNVSWALRIDTLTAVMLIVVTGVSSCVHIYSLGYMHDDPDRGRFMAYLSLFTFMMLMLVTSDNLLQMFFGWEGVGLASYLLIGFWFKKESANAASIKAFLVNRVGDFGFALGIIGTFWLFGSIEFDTILKIDNVQKAAAVSIHFLGMDLNALTLVCLLLFMGAMGKSAQLGLHTWLPDAMEGPTPVSALIHAATMVTAGVVMLARLSPMFEHAPTALEVVTLVGALTAFVAATIGMTQFDIKRVIAYSTMSQLGYMFFAAGVSAYGAAMFHLATHAAFKALLFLGAGSVIHALGGEQDIRRMGRVWKDIPFTYGVMWIGSLALAGIPIFAGYYSKDAVLESAWAHGSVLGKAAYWMGIAAAFMTAFYSWRLLLLTFHSTDRVDHHVREHIHESPQSMTHPLALLAAFAITAGWIGHHAFVGDGYDNFWKNAIYTAKHYSYQHLEHVIHETPWVKHAPLVAGLLGISMAYLCYSVFPRLPSIFTGVFSWLHALFFRKWFFDELYNAIFVRPAWFLGRVLWKRGDQGIIDRFGPDGISAASARVAGIMSRFQTGYVFHYAFAMLLGIFALVSWYIVSDKLH